MKRSTRLWLIVSAFLLTLGLLIVLVSFFAAGFSIYGYEMNHTYEEQSYTFASEEITSVQFVDRGMDLRVVESADNDFHLTCYVKGSDNYHTEVTDHGKLRIEATTAYRAWWRNLSVSFHPPKVETVLAVPADHHVAAWEFQLDSGDVLMNLPDWKGDLQITTDSGRICLEQMTLQGDLTLTSQSGDQFLRRCEAQEVMLHTQSGSIYINHLEAGTLSTKSVSGDQSLQDLTCRSLFFSAQSGDVEGQDLKNLELLQGTTDSGDIEIFSMEVRNGNLRTQSGDVEIDLAADICTVIATSHSGEIRLPAPNAGKGTLLIDTQSGDITVETFAKE